jgi:3',5'-cyclic AMP phosphodiesterase CpdA
MVVISDLNSSYGSTTYDPEVDLGIQLIPFWSPDLVVCGGDMVAGQDDTLSDSQIKAMWNGFDQHIGAPLRKMNVPFGFTIGNHDGSSALGTSNQFLFRRDRAAVATYWNSPNHDPGVQFVDKYEFPFYYTFQFQDVFFLVWDGSSNTIPADKLKWVEKALASEKAQSAKMRILVGHLPLYSVAAGRNTFGDVMRDADQLRAMLEKYQVHTYISGHHHAYYPAHRGNLQMLHAGILGSGPRSLLDTGLPPRKAITVIDIKFDSPELTTYTTYDTETLQVIEFKELPRLLTGVNGLLLRRDVDWNQLTADERSRCENRLGGSLCSA